LCQKEILSTTALYGPWTPTGTFDWPSYENLVRKVVQSGSVPATNVDTTWAIYNEWALARKLIWRTAEIAQEYQQHLAPDRPLLVAGLNTNEQNITWKEIVPTLRQQIEEIQVGLKARAIERIRYMIMPDKRLLGAPSTQKVAIYREIGQLIGDFTDLGMVFFELDIGIPAFGSDFSPAEIVEILSATPQIQEYKSALIRQRTDLSYPFDFRDDLVRIRIVENVAAERIQFSTGNDWFLTLARCGRNIKRHGYLLGAALISPALFQRWRNGVQKGELEALAIENDLQAVARDFWTPGNVGIYRHYLAIFLAMTGLIAHPLPHPRCDARYRVHPADYFTPLRHARRLGLVDPADLPAIVRHFIPDCPDWSAAELQRRIEWLG
jgi:hypothetical protein